jgi:hypothetical protein
MQYFVLPHCCIAFNAKVASSALASSIVRKYHPERLTKALDDYEKNWSQFSDEFKKSLPESFQKMFRCDMNDSISFWQNLCTITRKPEKTVLLLIRNPIDRFVSGVAYLEQDIEKVLHGLETNDQQFVIEKLPINIRQNTHFIKQSWLVYGETKLYKFPDDLEQFCTAAQLDWPLEKINEGKHQKPKLTLEQMNRIENYYAEDVALWKYLCNLKKAGASVPPFVTSCDICP